MKYAITIVLLSLLTVCTYAQAGINYKALIKDANNAVVANVQVTIQFSILEGVAQTNVYQETHTPITDSNGIIIINIGEGAVNSGVFANINWASDDHFLNTQVNTGTGLVNMGTTGFSAVPYALSAKTAETAANVSGFESIDEGNGLGLIKMGRNSANYGNVGGNAVDLSFSNTTSTTNGATGQNAIAIGNNTTASSFVSIAMGNNTEASGIQSTSMGSNAEASGFVSTAMGGNTEASGAYSTSMGYYTQANSLYSTAHGYYNIGGGSPTAYLLTDPVFEIGNGISTSNRSNALTVLKNGTITAPSFDISEITDSKALITKEYADRITPTGLEAIDEGNGLGLVKVDRYPLRYGNIGEDAVDLSYSDVGTTIHGATGSRSTAMGRNTVASGFNSTAMGNNTVASGGSSTAMGSSTIALASSSIAMGNNAVAGGQSSTAIGYFTQANSVNSIAIGQYNVGGGHVNLEIPTDPLFEVGNGLSNTTRSNAITVLKNGNVAIGNITPGHVLDIYGRPRVRRGNGESTAGIWYSDSSGDDHIFAGVKAHHATNVGSRQWGVYMNGWNFWVNGNGDVVVSGATVHSSDRRLKKDIETIPYGLNEILQLQPKAYNWKAKGKEHKSLGLIAQDVQSVIKNVVQIADDEKQTLGVSYTELIPVLIKAMQEQQDIIGAQAKKIEELEKKSKRLASIEARLSAIEAENTKLALTVDVTEAIKE